MREIPSYHPPADYRRPVKTQEKVYVPVNDYPEINFSELDIPLTFFLCTIFRCVHLSSMTHVRRANPLTRLDFKRSDTNEHFPIHSRVADWTSW
jgi:hypothetical protein